jgi:predicted glycoside hydrolase/deacetylase ChbG (UPF0249 family)
MSVRQLILCADDYGISTGVSLAIRQLAEAGRLSATGVMSLMPAWEREAPALRPLAGQVAIGLHFTLTDQTPLGPMPRLAPGGRFPAIGTLVKWALRGRLAADEVTAELDRQLDRFEALMGRPPDFVDGHQHVHLLPGVRGPLLAAFGRRLDPARVWLRDCADGAWWRRRSAAKAGVVALLASGFAGQARRRGIRLNRGFSGFYDPARYTLAEALPDMLIGAEDGHLMMIHPGHVDAELRAVDSLTDSRETEWVFVNGPLFPQILAAEGYAVARPGEQPR